MTGHGVHAAHCCHLHGCKYGDNECPVWTGEIAQKHYCEFCNYNEADFTILTYLDKKITETNVDDVKRLALLVEIKEFAVNRIRDDYSE